MSFPVRFPPRATPATPRDTLPPALCPAHATLCTLCKAGARHARRGRDRLSPVNHLGRAEPPAKPHPPAAPGKEGQPQPPPPPPPSSPPLPPLPAPPALPPSQATAAARPRAPPADTDLLTSHFPCPAHTADIPRAPRGAPPVLARAPRCRELLRVTRTAPSLRLPRATAPSPVNERRLPAEHPACPPVTSHELALNKLEERERVPRRRPRRRTARRRRAGRPADERAPPRRGTAQQARQDVSGRRSTPPPVPRRPRWRLKRRTGAR